MIGKQAQILAKYYEILEIAPDASVAEVKQAFINKARKVHPTKNESEESRNQYELLKKAYYYIIGVKTGRIPLEKKTKNLDTGFELRHYQARAFPYKDRKKSYRINIKPSSKVQADIDTMTILLAYASIFFTFLMWPLWPIVIAQKETRKVELVTLVFIIMTSPFIIMPWRSLRKKTKEAKRAAFRRLSKSVFLYVMFGFVVSLIGFALFVSRTLLGSFEIAFIFFLPFFVCFVLLPRVIDNFMNKSRLICFVLWPLLFNLFFGFNFMYSKPSHTVVVSYDESQKNNYFVHFKGNRFDEYYHIRFFYERQYLLKHYSKIDFKVYKGFFGINVIKNYEFQK